MLALGEARFGGGNLAIDGQPVRLVVDRMDIDRCGVARWCPSFGAGPTDEAAARKLVKTEPFS